MRTQKTGKQGGREQQPLAAAVPDESRKPQVPMQASAYEYAYEYEREGKREGLFSSWSSTDPTKQQEYQCGMLTVNTAEC
jgi:hypothetical protein